MEDFSFQKINSKPENNCFIVSGQIMKYFLVAIPEISGKYMIKYKFIDYKYYEFDISRQYLIIIEDVHLSDNQKIME